MSSVPFPRTATSILFIYGYPSGKVNLGVRQKTAKVAFCKPLGRRKVQAGFERSGQMALLSLS